MKDTAYDPFESMEKGCWNCKWDHVSVENEPCNSCYMFGSWEEGLQVKENG